jgi:hypothetical protein
LASNGPASSCIDPSQVRPHALPGSSARPCSGGERSTGRAPPHGSSAPPATSPLSAAVAPPDTSPLPAAAAPAAALGLLRPEMRLDSSNVQCHAVSFAEVVDVGLALQLYPMSWRWPPFCTGLGMLLQGIRRAETEVGARASVAKPRPSATQTRWSSSTAVNAELRSAQLPLEPSALPNPTRQQQTRRFFAHPWWPCLRFPTSFVDLTLSLTAELAIHVCRS